MKLFFIDVLLPFPLAQGFTYSISKAEADFLSVGCRVVVPFGKQKKYTGLVLEIHQRKPSGYEIKSIDFILDKTPIVHPSQIDFWKWVSNYYMTPLGTVMKTALPSTFLLQSETEIAVVPQSNPIIELSEAAQSLYDQLTLSSPIALGALPFKMSVAQELIDKGMAQLQEEVYEKYAPKKQTFIRWGQVWKSNSQKSIILSNLNSKPKQLNIIKTLIDLEEKGHRATPALLKNKFGHSVSSLNTLVKHQILEKFEEVVDRMKFESSVQQALPKLANAQQEALESIQKQFESKNVVLLHGVTSSGKTAVYLHLIEEALKKGEQVLYLLPEIALTTQVLSRFQDYFANQMVIYHSQYSLQERVEVWHKVKRQSLDSRLVIGARSSIFLPFSNLGLVVVDESHENSYKQSEAAPRYQGRDTAIVLAHQLGARVLLGTATPSVESFVAVTKQKYGLATLQHRFTSANPPEIKLIDLKRAAFKKELKGSFSLELIQAVTTCLNQGQQVILFQNRRGFSPYLECDQCGHIPSCDQCDVRLTYHVTDQSLRCHYCGYNEFKSQHCVACHHPQLTTKGLGTQRVELELKALFPKARLGRLDFDVTRKKNSYKNILDSFEKGDIDVLVGTQMISKGLDFENVGLVGVLHADGLLHYPDFRAHERAFQLLLQVAGRAGRSSKQGKVLIQTYNPAHPLLAWVQQADYQTFVENEWEQRQLFDYPPKTRLIRLQFGHRDYERVFQGANWVATALVQSFGPAIKGPHPPIVSRVRGRYLQQVIIKIPENIHLAKSKARIQAVLKSFEAIPQFRAVMVVVDVDP